METVKMVFPKKHWTKGNPEDFGFTRESLNLIDEKMKQAEANGVLVQNGYLLAEWCHAGLPEKTVEVQSCTKSITSMLLGLAVQDGLIPGIDARVKNYWPDFETGPYTDKITFRHLVTMTSGISAGEPFVNPLEYVDPGNMEPGKEYHYTNSQPIALACALTCLYGRKLEDVIKEKVLKVIGTEDEFEWWTGGQARSPQKIITARGKEVPVNIGSWGSHWTARDLARVGLLYLNKGMWEGQRVLDEQFVEESLTDIPYKINEWRRGTWLEMQPRTEADLAKLGYGLGWWTTRGDITRVWNMGGNGGQFCMLLPEYGVIMTKINGYTKRPFVNKNEFVSIIEKTKGRFS